MSEEQTLRRCLGFFLETVDSEQIIDRLLYLENEVTRLLGNSEQKSADRISVVWHIDDVKSIDDSLTDDQCRAVLGMAERKHDANEGINWQVLDIWIDYIKEKG
jgi:hypothetical protein